MIPKVLKFPLCRIENNPNAHVTPNYNIVDDLVQSSTSISTLEDLRNCPMQRKSLLLTLGVIDPFNSHLTTFYLDQVDP